MAFEKKVPEWNAAGSEPPASLKNSGFTAGYKPPADYFNWFWYNVSQALAELQSKAVEHYSGMVDTTYTLNDALTRGKYLVTGNNIEGAPYTGNVYGTLFVFMADNKETWSGGNLHWLTQIFVDTNGKTFIRQRINDAAFTAWAQFYTSTNKPTLNELSGKVSIAKGGTGADNNLDALDNLSAIASYRGTVNSTDRSFNEALTQGEYMVTGTDIDGAPYTGTIYGKLLVTVSNGHTHDGANNWIWQTFYSTKFGYIYIRNKVNAGVWSDWSVCYNANNKPAPKDIGAMDAKPTNIELIPASDANNGGYVDFHYNGSTEDYTSRIIESAEGRLSLEAINGARAGSGCQAPGNSILRNSKLANSESTPTINGEIVWVYE